MTKIEAVGRRRDQEVVGLLGHTKDLSFVLSVGELCSCASITTIEF